MEPTCPHCKVKLSEQSDHRLCLFAMFETNLIKSVADWEALCRPKTIRKGRIRVLLPKE